MILVPCGVSITATAAQHVGLLRPGRGRGHASKGQGASMPVQYKFANGLYNV